MVLDNIVGMDTILAILLLVSLVIYGAYQLFKKYPGLKFLLNSLRFRTFWKEIKNYEIRRFLIRLSEEKKYLITYWSFPFSILLILFLLFWAYIFPQEWNRNLNFIRDSLLVQATITSLSFIVLVFLLRLIQHSQHRKNVMHEYLAQSGIMPILYFTVISTGVITWIYFSQSPNNPTQFAINAAFYLTMGTIFSILLAYYLVVKISLQEIDQLAIKKIKIGLKMMIWDYDRTNYYRTLLEKALPKGIRVGVEGDRLFTAEELGLYGQILDINLAKLEQTFKNENFKNSTIYLNIAASSSGPNIGNNVQEEDDIILTDNEQIEVSRFSENFKRMLNQAIFCTSSRSFMNSEDQVNRNLDWLGEASRSAIQNRSPSGLRKHLDSYIDIIRFIFESLEKEMESTNNFEELLEIKQDFSQSALRKIINRIYFELNQIGEAIAKTQSYYLIKIFKNEIYSLTSLFHKKKRDIYFRKTVEMYWRFYEFLLSNDVNKDLAKTILFSLENIQKVLLKPDFEESESCEEINQYYEKQLKFWFNSLRHILRSSIKHSYPENFKEAWNLIQKQFRHLEKMKSKTDLKCKKEKKRIIDDIEEKVKKTKFLASAKIYQRFQEEKLDRDIFKEMFKKIRNEYSDFRDLTEIYFELSKDPSVFSSWEEEISFFKGAQTIESEIEDWKKEFYCVMSVILLEPNQFDSEDIDKNVNPMTDFDIKKTNYPDLKPVIQKISKENFKGIDEVEDVLDQLKERKNLFKKLDENMEKHIKKKHKS